MSTRIHSRLARVALTLVVGAALLVSTDAMQQREGVGRAMVRDGGLQGIDVGLREREAVVHPRARGPLGSRGQIELEQTGRSNPTRHLTNSVIVKFRDGAGPAAVVSAMRQASGTKLSRPSHADFDLVEIAAGADPEAIATTFAAQPDVEWAQPRYRVYPMLRPNDPLYDRQWNFPAIDMERAWDVQPAAGSEITVAVLDSGVAFRTTTLRYVSAFPFRLTAGGPVFPALGAVDVPFAVAPELGTAKFVSPRDFIWEDDLPVDLDGHGTHVSGTLGQLTNNGVGVAGMAYNVRIMPVKVIDGEWDFIFDSPNFGTDDTVARGIRYATDNGAQVINMSLGRETGGRPLAIEDAIRYAVSRGVFVAVAGGNAAEDGNPANRIAEAAPSIDGMMAVAAVGRTLERSFFSTTNAYVEIAAPGGDQRVAGTNGILQQTVNLELLHTYSQGPTRLIPPRADTFAYYYFQGTSMATPHVAGFAAMLMQQGITSPAAIEAAMKQFARDLGRAGVDPEYGYGLIQPRTTLRGLGLAR